MAGRSSKKKQKGTAPVVVDGRVAEMKAGILQIESLLKEAADMVTAEMQRADDITGRLGETAARIEAGNREKEEILREKDSALRELDSKLTSRIQELETQLKEKDTHLESRELEIGDLRSRLQGLELSREAAVSLDEENVVLLEEVESGPGDGTNPVEPAEEAARHLETGGPARGKPKLIEQSMRGVAIRSAKTVEPESGGGKKMTTLVSLLSPMKKGL